MKNIKGFKIYHNRYKKIFNVKEVTFDKNGNISGGSFFFGRDAVPFNIKEVDILHVFK